MNKNRRATNLLTVGTLMGLLVATLLLFDSSGLQKVLAAQFPGMALTAGENVPVEADAAAVDPQLITLVQEQNAALRATIQTMQTREGEYRTTIEKANLMLQQMESNTTAQLANTNSTTSTLEQQNGEIRQAVETLQEREGQYRTQLDTANQTIRQLEEAVQQRQIGIQTLQSQNDELIKAVQLMQERERQYQTQLQAATEALQNSSSYQTGNSSGGYEEHEEHDDD